jgi:DsbC/DsbD-like thiol-disulfide interchange protein
MIATGLRRLPLLIAACALASASSHAFGADSSAWDRDARAGIRLIAGNASSDGAQRAGLEMNLAPGWKTYWRYPGDSGVPPRFDFTRSENVKSVSVLWPAPRRIEEAGGFTIGYKERVVFPLRVVPQDKTKPVVLRLKLDYAICEKLCVPAEGSAELPLTETKSSLDGALAAAEAQVPKPAALNDGKAFAIRSVHRDAASTPQKVFVDVAAPENAKIDLFAEGPTESWALPLPAPVSGAPAGQRRFAFDLDGLPSGAKAEGAELVLTAVAPEGAIEVKARLD